MSRILDEMHESMTDLYNEGLVDKKTMRDFDVLCLKTVQALSPDEIKAIRLKENISQAIFAAYLNTSLSAIRKWESGEKKPSGLALRLLNLVKEKGLAIIST